MIFHLFTCTMLKYVVLKCCDRLTTASLALDCYADLIALKKGAMALCFVHYFIIILFCVLGLIANKSNDPSKANTDPSLTRLILNVFISSDKRRNKEN